MQSISIFSNIKLMMLYPGMIKYMIIPIIMGIICMIYLGYNAYVDIKFKEIPVNIALITSVVGVVLTFLATIISGIMSVEMIFSVVKTLIISLIPGVVLYLVSKITNQIIGYGDAMVVGVIGLYLGAKNVVNIMLIAFFIAGLIALYEIVIMKKNKRYEMPFVPFLFVSYVFINLIKFLF